MHHNMEIIPHGDLFRCLKRAQHPLRPITEVLPIGQE